MLSKSGTHTKNMQKKLRILFHSLTFALIEYYTYIESCSRFTNNKYGRSRTTINTIQSRYNDGCLFGIQIVNARNNLCQILYRFFVFFLFSVLLLGIHILRHLFAVYHMLSSPLVYINQNRI